MLFFQFLHAVNHHAFADASHAVVLMNAYMVKAASSAVMSAENASYNSVIFYRYYAGFRISLQKSLHPSLESSMLRMAKPLIVIQRA
jgi:hypothetical protein